MTTWFELTYRDADDTACTIEGTNYIPPSIPPPTAIIDLEDGSTMWIPWDRVVVVHAWERPDEEREEVISDDGVNRDAGDRSSG